MAKTEVRESVVENTNGMRIVEQALENKQEVTQS